MWWQRWLRFWRDRIGNAEFEAAIRAALRSRGGGYAHAPVRDFRLAAIARPGWVQVYRFTTGAQEDGVAPLWGLLRDDGRRGTQVLLFASAAECQRQFALWSEGLILSPSERR
jgi:hypothetical protein